MPPLRLTSLLQTALPHLSDSGRALLSALGCLNGHPPCTKELAQWLGFHDRYQLARALRREGLPPLEVIGGWTRTLYWMLEAETSGLSLRELAEREHIDPAVAYRLVRRITGNRWSEVRRGGLAVALLRFRDRCGNGKAVLSKPAQPLAIAVGDRAVRPPARNGVGHTRPLTFGQRPAPPQLPGHRVPQTIAERVLVGGAPFDLAVSGRNVLITRTHASAVDILQLDPLRVVHTIRVGPAPTRVVPAGRSQWVYVTSQFAEAVCVVDMDRKAQVGLIHVPGHALAGAMSPDGVTLFVTTNQDRLLTISPLQRIVTSSVAIPLACPEITVHPSGRWIYVPCWRAGTIVEVDVPTLDIVRRFDVGGIAQDALVSSDGQTLYVANESGWLDVIHLPSGRRTTTVEFGTGALAITMSSDEQYLFVGLLNAGRIVVLQRQGLVERAAIPTGGKPRHMIADPRGEGVLVANEDGWVDLLR